VTHLLRKNTLDATYCRLIQPKLDVVSMVTAIGGSEVIGKLFEMYTKHMCRLVNELVSGRPIDITVHGATVRVIGSSQVTQSTKFTEQSPREAYGRSASKETPPSLYGTRSLITAFRRAQPRPLRHMNLVRNLPPCFLEIYFNKECFTRYWPKSFSYNF
jgi:hypothetical protein